MSLDYIIVGAGSAGCALTHELVKAGQTVLLIEAGGRDWSPYIKVAAAQPQACAAHDWGYHSRPDPSRHGATEHWIRGRVLGGSSSINGTMYTRGAPADFDRWKLPGWAWADVLPVFREFERSDQPGPFRGHAGPLHIRTVKRPHATTKAFIESAQAAGLSFLEDYNGASQEGVGYAQMSQRRGWRCSAADAFLKPLRGRKNLKLVLHALVEKIEVVNGHADAVCFSHQGTRRRETARHIVLCAGAINSPQLLMLSGIGDPQQLKPHHIDVVLDLPGVGCNLREQPLISMVYRSKIPTHNLTQGLFQKLAIAATFIASGEGPISNLFEGAAFVKSSPAESVPDLQLIFMALGYSKGPNCSVRMNPYPSFMVLMMDSYPLGSGRISLESQDPHDPPLIECRLLEKQHDVDRLVNGIGRVREIMRQEPIASLIEEETAPGATYDNPPALERYVRDHSEISLHPIGTCRMGTDPAAVVGADLRVHGTDNLWIADASIIPEHMSANMNAACIMIGMKLGKELIAGSH